ncbi:hypothetical protein [Dyella sp. GSA-30]|uniref:hypothetical protein n=1 Tax=Dyella sp. GSA-30 TaxID=2994496 RepID=UPI0024910F2D|nr:hypothetical protein [Dyella sp. GSA-30]
MNEDTDDTSLDEAIALYKRHAREAPEAMVDTRILRIALNSNRQRRAMRQLPWLIAAAASVMVWLGIAQPFAAHHPTSPGHVETHPPGYLEGSSRAYLLGMDVSPPTSDVAAYLRHPSYTSP